MSMAVFQSLLNHEFSVSRLSRVSDGQGGWTESLVPAGTLRGRMRPASSQEREAAALAERQISHVLYTLAGADIQRGDTVTLGALSVQVDAIREPSQAQEHIEVDCLERQVEGPSPL